MKLLIVGAGGYGLLVREMAEAQGYKVDFLDDNSPLAVGKVENLEKIEGEYDGSIVSIGNPEIKQKILRRMKNLVTLIHPTACVSVSAVIGTGCVIEANTVVNSNAVVNDGSFICAGAVVNHNAVVGKFCQIDCNAVVAVGAKVPESTKVQSCTVFK